MNCLKNFTIINLIKFIKNLTIGKLITSISVILIYGGVIYWELTNEGYAFEINGNLLVGVVEAITVLIILLTFIFIPLIKNWNKKIFK